MYRVVLYLGPCGSMVLFSVSRPTGTIAHRRTLLSFASTGSLFARVVASLYAPSCTRSLRGRFGPSPSSSTTTRSLFK